jgi:hypothetical protein
VINSFTGITEGVGFRKEATVTIGKIAAVTIVTKDCATLYTTYVDMMEQAE